MPADSSAASSIPFRIFLCLAASLVASAYKARPAVTATIAAAKATYGLANTAKLFAICASVANLVASLSSLYPSNTRLAPSANAIAPTAADSNFSACSSVNAPDNAKLPANTSTESDRDWETSI